MKSTLLIAAFASLILVGVRLVSQVPNPQTVVPHLVKFGGNLVDAQAKPLSGTVGVTFSIYEDQTGGAPLWMEVQNVSADSKGHYTALLGATKEDGVPLDIFVSGEAQWLGVRAEGQEEQARILLVSVPYALKAADADTLGGMPASAFMPAPQPEFPTAESETIASGGVGLTSKTNKIRPNVAGSGTQNYIPIWTDNLGTLGNSIIYQSGGAVGIGTTSPVYKLDIVGPAGITSFTGLSRLGLMVSGSSATTDYSGIDFSGDSYGGVPFGRIGLETTGGGSYLRFGTSNNYAAGITNTAMTIDYSGNVGIGTTAPAYGLDVSATAQVGRLIVNGGITPTGSGLKHARTSASCTTGSSIGDICTIAVSWTGTPFADTNYTATCNVRTSVTGSSGSTEVAFVILIYDADKSTTGMNVPIETLSQGTAVTVNGLDCIAIHD